MREEEKAVFVPMQNIALKRHTWQTTDTSPLLLIYIYISLPYKNGLRRDMEEGEERRMPSLHHPLFLHTHTPLHLGGDWRERTDELGGTHRHLSSPQLLLPFPGKRGRHLHKKKKEAHCTAVGAGTHTHSIVCIFVAGRERKGRREAVNGGPCMSMVSV